MSAQHNSVGEAACGCGVDVQEVKEVNGQPQSSRVVTDAILRAYASAQTQRLAKHKAQFAFEKKLGICCN